MIVYILLLKNPLALKSIFDTPPTLAYNVAKEVCTMSNEIWKPCVGWEKYEVSNLGRVRSVRTGRPFYAKPDRKGYIRVTFRDHGRRESPAVHHLVLDAFVGPRPHGYVTNHKNCDKSDNRIENLEWVRQVDNVRHAIEHGHFSFTGKGEAHPNSKVTADDVREIRRLFATGDYSKAALGRQFGITDVMVGNIVRRTSWSHIA